jgi:hypothetical protein
MLSSGSFALGKNVNYITILSLVHGETRKIHFSNISPTLVIILKSFSKILLVNYIKFRIQSARASNMEFV